MRVALVALAATAGNLAVRAASVVGERLLDLERCLGILVRGGEGHAAAPRHRQRLPGAPGDRPRSACATSAMTPTVRSFASGRSTAANCTPLSRSVSRKPLIVRSAYRRPEHNRAVAGVKALKHMEGIAFDIAMANHDPEAFKAATPAPSAAREVMAPLMLSFLRRYPQVHIDLVTEGRLVDIVAAGFDMGLRPADLVPSDMIAVSLGLERRNAVVASPDFLRTHGRPTVPADLYRFRCIRSRLPNNALLRWRFEKDGNAVQMDVQGSIILDEPSLVRIAAQSGIGLGYVMEADVRDDIAAGRLVRILEDWTPSWAPLALYYPSRKNPPAAFTAFIQAAREFANQRPR
jgi:DNA-binding transcriptional LysR family regulator